MEYYKRPTLCVLDIDGTLFDNFFEVDRKIIEHIYSKSRGYKAVIQLDEMLRSINNFGVIGQNNGLLKFRLALYEIAALKSTKIDPYGIYKNMYLEEFFNTIDAKKKILGWNFSKLGDEVIAYTANKFLEDIRIPGLNLRVINSKKAAFGDAIRYSQPNSIITFVGDNLHDDIWPLKKLRNICNDIEVRTVYIGNSIFARADQIFGSFSEYTESLLKV